MQLIISKSIVKSTKIIMRCKKASSYCSAKNKMFKTQINRRD